ncbi:DUF4153 domain-containing protein [Methylocystis heyeri]|uniref:DUF4173 domain-containing protein n=1 Tax=Methylocystis heyeri TaxID=391905 RepID=A0A6B8KFY8_9HYPH|nr:DUF4173 domain-containing protein [Methylocystis heyeri]QGM46522.1 DUF4173 domain-containing protein [Methylocystis heyeri]
MTIEAPSLARRTPARWFVNRLMLATGAAALADWLFYNAYPLGVSVAIFLGSCAVLAIGTNPVRAHPRLRIGASIALLLALLAVVEEVSWLSFLVASGATSLFALMMVSGDFAAWPSQLRRALGLPLAGPFWLAGDAFRARRLSLRKGKPAGRIAALASWIAPILLGSIFLALFASANPLIEDWVQELDPRRIFELVSVARAVFWLLVICSIWPLLHLRFSRKAARAALASGTSPAGDFEALFGKVAVLRSLLLFNALFAVQTSLDFAYLWGGLALPNGLTYAAYAHRGAYPLVATTLLAAGFVLVAMRRGGPAETSPWIKPLVLAWVAQNLMLVASSIFRTGLYIAAYSLSELRLAALIWMALVAVGLALIVVQIVWRKTSRWLLNANAIATAITLYACCWIDFPAIVASYDIAHCLEISGTGPALDLDYLFALGPEAMPAYDEFLQAYWRRNQTGKSSGQIAWSQNERRSNAETASRLNWRSRTFRGWRLQRYFDTHPEGASTGERPLANQ